MVDVVVGVAVGATLIDSGIADNGQQIVAFVFGILASIICISFVHSMMSC